MVFSSLEGKNLIDALLSDAANATGRTLSAALEYHLLHDSLLPQNETAAAWIIMLYQQEKSIGNVISDLAAYLAAVEKIAMSKHFEPFCNFAKCGATMPQLLLTMNTRCPTYDASQLCD